jgi:hypothetical protein
LVGGVFGPLVGPIVARGVPRSFTADLVRLKEILEPDTSRTEQADDTRE